MLNHVTLMGRLTKEPETRYGSTNNTLICSFNLAVGRKFKKDETDFINIVAFGKLGEFCSKYFTKGRQVVVCGRLQTRTWDDNDNKRHYVTEVIADECYPCGNKNEKNNNEPLEDNFFTVVSDEELP